MKVIITTNSETKTAETVIEVVDKTKPFKKVKVEQLSVAKRVHITKLLSRKFKEVN